MAVLDSPRSPVGIVAVHRLLPEQAWRVLPVACCSRVADAGKVGRERSVRVAELGAVRDVVTEHRLPAGWLARLAAEGIQVHLAPDS